MDSERRANWPVIIALVMGVPGWIMLALLVWFRLYPDPKQAPTFDGTSLVSGYGWGPPIFLSILLVVTTILNLVVARRGGRKLKGQIEELTKTNKTLLSDKTMLAGNLMEANRTSQEWKTKYHESNNGGIEIRNERDNYARQLTKANEQIENLTAELAQSKRDAENANKIANQETNQKNEFYRLYNESERKLGDLAWLQRIAEEQAKNISEHIKVTAVKASNLRLDSSRHVRVALRILNESVFDITIRAENVRGSLFFNTKPSREPARILDTDRPPIENLKPKQEETLVIEQPLLQSEAETISETDGEARFWLGNLSIPISVENAPQQVETQDLRIRAEVEHIYLKEFGFGTTALILDDHAMTPKELIQNINALRPTLRAKVYQEALSAYVAVLRQEADKELDREFS